MSYLNPKVVDKTILKDTVWKYPPDKIKHILLKEDKIIFSYHAPYEDGELGDLLLSKELNKSYLVGHKKDYENIGWKYAWVPYTEELPPFAQMIRAMFL